MSGYSPITNFLVYQSAWFACIVTAARGLPWIGSTAALLAVAWHLYRVRRGASELLMILSVGAIGLLWESILVQTGWIVYPSGNFSAAFAPHWIIALWLVFATTFNVSLKWLRDRLVWAAVFGLLGGPLAFYAGDLLGALKLVRLPHALLAIALAWSILMPTMLMLARRLAALDMLSDGVGVPAGDSCGENTRC